MTITKCICTLGLLYGLVFHFFTQSAVHALLRNARTVGSGRRMLYMTRDNDIEKAKKVLQKTQLRKEAKTQRKLENAAARKESQQPRSKQTKTTEEDDADKSSPSFARQTVWGQNLINCRDFSLDSPKQFSFLGSYTSLKSLPVYPLPEIAFLGRSNVGKSSLLNTLTGMNKGIAVESKTPGRTQCINQFNCKDKDGGICLFVDLPGYGYAKISKSQQDEISELLRMYLMDRGPLRLAILLVDSRREPQKSDLEMVQFLNEEGLPFVVVATKVDKLKRDELQRSAGAIRKAYSLGANQPLLFSSVTGQGKKELWRVIRDVIIGKSELLELGESDGEDEEDNGQITEDYEPDELESYMD